jgi:hypothetical protein
VATGDLDLKGRDYVRHPLIGGGLNESFLSCGAHAQNPFVAPSWVARFCALDQFGRLVIGEIHNSRARALPNSASKSDTPVARRSTLEYRARHFRRGGLDISIVKQ